MGIYTVSISKLAYIEVEAESAEEAESKACDIEVPDDDFDVVIECTEGPEE